MTFSGFSPAALTFLRSLARNNRRDWFQPRKPQYEELLKQPMVQLIEAINYELAEFAPHYVTPPQKAMMRIYRDTRFSHDKTPYNPRMAAVFTLQSAGKHSVACFYFHINAKGLLLWAGVHMPPREELLAMRMLLAERHEEFRKIIKTPALRRLMGTMQCEQLSRVPKGFAKDHPAADLLRMTEWGFRSEHAASLAATSRLLPEIVKRYRVLAPMIEFLNQPFAQSRAREQQKKMFMSF
jgi:uncharacterized protein (TIGR02453 family)